MSTIYYFSNKTNGIKTCTANFGSQVKLEREIVVTSKNINGIKRLFVDIKRIFGDINIRLIFSYTDNV